LWANRQDRRRGTKISGDKKKDELQKKKRWDKEISIKKKEQSD
jgi:hypothetical protein